MKLPRLKEVRELHGWSQKKLAEEAGVSRDSISNYETSQREAWPGTAKRLADALGVEIADLRERAREPAVPLDEAPETGPSLLDRAQDAARQDEEKDARVLARESASEGLAAEVPSGYEEDKFRAELRTLGFPDKHFEDFIWPLVLESIRVEPLEQEIAQLREENAMLRNRLQEREQAHS